ncbi:MULTISPECIES: hypothetical protein [Burkholderia cepacia complex]|uniref:hypothetical protein n=1 Tax=Burkholderia cepacia complex TaxID=87882 RepID=UPI0011B28CC7|nr:MULTISPECIES: hypothetical protein [Burkholderia cepacia complex]MBR8373945.1 hypothetical protein [Burkholderia cenocepacia]MBR8442949.1 hypothetical protein [Burkholderia cenocepacia]MBU9122929.1 hypothetical protein [Burkholderia multivorans]MDN7867567.1 hypothetical protein [Burkholderia multivorans]MDR8920777.1 hypothetical protein [Burkholderia multivorans]
MNAIDEQELMDYAANGVISHFKIRETDEGRFCLVLTVSWKEGECILTSARKTPRLWANVNTLAEYLRKLNQPKVPISLELSFQGPS